MSKSLCFNNSPFVGRQSWWWGAASWTILNDSFILGYLTYICFCPLNLSPLFFGLFNSASHWYWGVMKIYVGSSGGPQEKGNIIVVEFYFFWFVKFLFILNKLQIVNRPISGWEREWLKPNSFGTYYEWTRTKEKQRRKNIKFWCLGYALPDGFLFFHNLHKFWNTDKTFLQEFSFITWLAQIDWFTPSLTPY